MLLSFFFFFSSRRRHTRFSRDWSSDVCSSDLRLTAAALRQGAGQLPPLSYWQAVRIGVQDLNAHVIGARAKVILHAARDSVEITPREDGIDEPIAAARGQVCVGEPQPP